MDRDTLNGLLRKGPVRVTMNDGKEYDIPSFELALVSDTTAHVLYKAEDGKMKSHFLSLVCMVRVEELETAND